MKIVSFLIAFVIFSIVILFHELGPWTDYLWDTKRRNQILH